MWGLQGPTSPSTSLYLCFDLSLFLLTPPFSLLALVLVYLLNTKET